jgi:phage-related protein (TIGR01555 family)
VASRKTKPEAAANLASATRSDGWENHLTGIGTWRDKLQAGHYYPDLLLGFQELSDLYYGNDLAATIVDAPIDEAFRTPFTPTAEDAEQVKDLRDWANDVHDLETKTAQGLQLARLFGGALIVIGADDGQPLSEPLNPNRVKDIPWTLVVDRRYAFTLSYYQTLGPKLGAPERYRVTAQRITGATSLDVHESRCVRFGSIQTDPIKAAALQGWDLPALMRPYPILRDFSAAMQSAGIMLGDGSQGVFRVKGLYQMLVSNEKQALRKRMEMLDMSRSAARAIMVDADSEGYEVISRQFNGIPDLIDRFMQRLSAASEGIPVSILMGRSAAGMNATGELDAKSWQAKVGTYRQKKVNPAIIRALTLLSLSRSAPTRGMPPAALKIQWEPLSVPTAKEDAEAYSTRATADATYLDRGVIDPAQVALARFGNGVYSTAVPSVDSEALQAELEAKTTFTDPNAAPGTETAAPVESAGPKLQLTASDIATIVTVNEARASQGLPPLPGPDGNLTLPEFKAKHAIILAAAANAESGKSADASATVKPNGADDAKP